MPAAVTSPATAQTVPVSFSGTIASGIDYIGLFGPIGTDLTGSPYTARVVYYPADFTYNYPPDCTYGYVTNTASAMTITLTINGFSNTTTAEPTQRYCDYTDDTYAAQVFIDAPPSLYVSMTANSDYLNGVGSGIDYTPSSTPTLLNPTAPSLTSGTDLFVSNGIKGDLFTGTVNGLTLVSPFLLGAKNLGDIDLAALLPNLQAPASALGLAADGTSAAIVLFQVSTKSPVTFTTNNGTTLVDYKNDFLKKAPVPGNTTLKVNPIQIGSLIYAVALLQAPPAGVTPAYSAPITITAQQQGGQVQQAYLPLVPPPVLLVHGLWGDKSSLTFYGQTLAAEQPWSSYPNLIYYSNYSGIDSFASPDSIAQLEHEISSELSSLQSAGTVVGRTDVVAHSMGGLLARAYSANTMGRSPYLSLVNREQGQFHTIVTADTPEAGSNLASYLILNQGNTLSPNASFTLTKLWDHFCGGSQVTVAQCFAKFKQSVTAGAVASLIPNSPELAAAPSPNIPNSSWLAITATNMAGIERHALQGIIDASNPGNDTIKLDHIIGGVNDDVVALSSQLAYTPDSSVTLSELAHAELFHHGDAVTNSPTAIQDIACWLNDPTSPSCGKAGHIVEVAISKSADDPVLTAGRVVAQRLPTTAVIGRPLRNV